MLIDEQDFVRLGLEKILSDAQGIKVVAQTPSYEDAIKLARQVSPQVILLDMHMPGLAGLDALRKLLRLDSDIKIIALTDNEDDAIPRLAFQAGACGFLTKYTHAEEAIRAVRVVHAGQRYLSPEMAQRLAFNHVDVVTEASPFNRLSEREMQITLLLINNERPIQIAAKLHLSPKTINGYRYRIFEKLSIQSDVELTKLAIIHRLISLNIDTTVTEA